MNDGNYKVDLTIESKKFRADSLGNEKEIQINDWIYIGILGQDDKKQETIIY